MKHQVIQGIFILLMSVSASYGAAVWPTLHNDYQRSGWTEELVEGAYERKWYRDFHGEMIATRVEAIVAEGKCYVGTFAGNLYALDVETGKTEWTFQADGPIGVAPCYHEGRLYVGADVASNRGHLYCIDVEDGSLVWRYESGAGIWASPACDGDNVYVGDRAGVLHAVSAASGSLQWSFATGYMILKPVSFSPNRRRILLGSEDMHMYCLSPNGELFWKTPKLSGLSMRDQGPTIWQNLAIVRTNPADAFHVVLGRNGNLLEQIQRSLPVEEEDKVLLDKWGDLVMHPTPRRRQAEQDGIVEYLREHPYDRCFYAFHVVDGNEPWIAPVLYTAGLHNPPTPPTFNPKTGELYTFCRTAMTYYLRGVRRYNALGRLDRETGRFDFYWPQADNDRNWYPMAMIGDETQALSMMDNMLISNHQGTLAALDLDTMDVTTIWAGRDTYGGIFGPAAVEGGFDGARRLGSQGYLTGMPNEWHGPDRSICAIAQDRFFWVVGSQVVCIAGPDVPKTAAGGTEPPPLKKSELPNAVTGGNVASKTSGVFDTSIAAKPLTRQQVAGYVNGAGPVGVAHDQGGPARYLRDRLEAQVLELINDGPWAPFIVELGISGEQRHFWRTARTMQSLAMAMPHLSPAVKAAAVTHLDRMFESGMPLSAPVHDNQGKRREPYDLGPGMEEFAAKEIKYQTNIEDLYAVWSYAHFAGRWNKVLAHKEQIAAVFSDFADEPFAFKHDGRDDESEQLNRRIAGVLAAVRMLRKAGDEDTAAKAADRLAEMLAKRIHHERADDWLIRPTRRASKGLHQASVPRYVDIAPELGAALADHATDAVTQNVRALMQGLPLWYQAFGERMIGGENYISPPQLSQGLFLALAFALDAEPAELTAKLDQPWCRADLHYIEKLTATLRRLDK